MKWISILVCLLLAGCAAPGQTAGTARNVGRDLYQFIEQEAGVDPKLIAMVFCWGAAVSLLGWLWKAPEQIEIRLFLWGFMVFLAIGMPILLYGVGR